MNHSKENLAVPTASSNDESGYINSREVSQRPCRLPMNTSTFDDVLSHKNGSTSFLHSSGSDATQISTEDSEKFRDGMRVWIGGIRPGHISYIGDVHFSHGQWAGIVLDEPIGQNDGSIFGKRYFKCKPKYGIFTRVTRLTLSSQTTESITSMSIAGASDAKERKSLNKTENLSADKEYVYDSKEHRPVLRSWSKSLLSLNIVDDDDDGEALNVPLVATSQTSHKEELRNLKQLLIDKDETIKNLKLTNGSMRAEMENIKQVNGSMRAEMENLKQKNDSMRTEMEYFQKIKLAMKLENTKALKSLQTLYSKYSYSRVVNKSLKSKNNALKLRFDEIRAARALSKLNVTRLEKLLEDSQTANKNVKCEYEKTKDKLEFQQTVNKIQIARVAKMSSDLQSLTTTNDNLKSKIETLDQNFKDISEAKARSDLNVSQLQNELLTLRAAYKHSKDEVLAIGLELDETKRESATNSDLLKAALATSKEKQEQLEVLRLERKKPLENSQNATTQTWNDEVRELKSNSQVNTNASEDDDDVMGESPKLPLKYCQYCKVYGHNFEGEYVEEVKMEYPKLTKLNVTNLEKLLEDSQIANKDVKFQYEKTKNMLAIQQTANKLHIEGVAKMSSKMQSLTTTNDNLKSKIERLEQQFKNMSEAKARSDLNVSQLQNVLLTLRAAYKQSKDEVLAIGLELDETKRESATNSDLLKAALATSTEKQKQLEVLRQERKKPLENSQNATTQTCNDEVRDLQSNSQVNTDASEDDDDVKGESPKLPLKYCQYCKAYGHNFEGEYFEEVEMRYLKIKYCQRCGVFGHHFMDCDDGRNY